MKLLSSCLIALMPLALSAPLAAWTHAGAWGGTVSHTPGSDSTTRSTGYGASATHTYGQGTTASNAYGASATHVQGSGQTTATNAYGASATHTYGQGTTATNAYGTTANHATGSGYTTYTAANGATAYHNPYYGAAYPAYHPPTTVNVYGSSCYNCGGWNTAGNTAGAAAAGVAVGVVAGTEIASANTAAATTNAYNAGVANGRAQAASPTPSATFAMGGIYATLPAGASQVTQYGTTYYVSGNTWFQPAYGANGVYYRVVPAP